MLICIAQVARTVLQNSFLKSYAYYKNFDVPEEETRENYLYTAIFIYLLVDP